MKNKVRFYFVKDRRRVKMENDEFKMMNGDQCVAEDD